MVEWTRKHRRVETLVHEEANGRRIVLNLRDLALVDQDAASFLKRCEADHITLKNCPAYIREWITRERNHPEGNSYIERFHRSLKEEEVWRAGYRSLEEARASIARWIAEYNHDRPHRGVQNRTPHEAFLAFAGILKNEAPTV